MYNTALEEQYRLLVSAQGRKIDFLHAVKTGCRNCLATNVPKAG